ncbi:MAG TPA: alpha/beta hydrolase [Gemmatimonadales bacterium]|jgi:hypothetical protein|nr:alpha/beta hydrolase [Gemmatimonadales bacterium]
MSWTILAAAVLIYAGILMLLRVYESRLIYFPGSERTLVAPPPSLGLPIQRVEITTEDAVNLVAWIIPAEPPSSLWLLVCHGNAGNLSEFDRPVHYAGLRELGLNLLAFDYRGYGESGGAPSEAGLYRDADAAYRYLTDQRGVPASRIVVFGHSLGSAVAVDLASRVPTAGLIVEGAFTSATDRGQELYPYIPVRWVAKSRFNSVDRISRATVPKLFLHAQGDEVIPLAHGRRLYQAAPPPKTFVELRGGHGDAFDVDSANYFGSIQRFLAALSSGE